MSGAERPVRAHRNASGQLRVSRSHADGARFGHARHVRDVHRRHRRVARPAPDRVILDCGAKTLALDGARGFKQKPGHGLVILPDGTPDPTLVIERLSEEHATVKATSPTRLKMAIASGMSEIARQ